MCATSAETCELCRKCYFFLCRTNVDGGRRRVEGDNHGVPEKPDRNLPGPGAPEKQPR